MLLGGYILRSDDVKVLVQETTEVRIIFHDRSWKNVSYKGTPGNPTYSLCTWGGPASLTLDSGTA